MTRRQFLGLPLLSAARAALDHPNLDIFLADDLGWGDVGFHGSETRTPHIDKLARDGVELERFYSYPVCSPTRSGLMTGRSALRLGAIYSVLRPYSAYGVPVEQHFMPQLVKAAGY